MDIDSDFCIEKGPLVFKYLNDKYGKENCCNIITFSRLTTKMVIKDVSKALYLLRKLMHLQQCCHQGQMMI